MPLVIRRLWLGFAIIAAISALLLLSDRNSRRFTRPGQKEQAAVAIVKHDSNALLDEVEQGMISAFEARGFKDGERIQLSRFSADNDQSTANLIAKRVTDGSYRLVLTASTLSLQAVAAANKGGKAVQVFAAVTDPVGAGVGIVRLNSTDKPPYLAGFGSFQPVGEIFHKAREFNPLLSKVGVVWNPSEANSLACTVKAREVTQQLGILLLEAPTEQSKEVPEAVASLASRGAEAIWTGCDVTAISAIDALTQAATRSRIPVFSNVSGHVSRGTLFDLGADYVVVGELAGNLAADILEGRNPADIPVKNEMPLRLALNESLLPSFPNWSFNSNALASAAMIVDASGQTTQTKAASAAAVPRKLWKLSLIQHSDSAAADEVRRGLHEFLQKSRLKEGQDYQLTEQNAQGDIATLNSLIDAALTRGTDLFITLSTPTLQAALPKVKDKPLIFSFVANPLIAGAGKSDIEHLPNVTGVYTIGPYHEMADLLARFFPNLKRIGTLFCPAEANSVYNKDLFTSEAKAKGIEVVAVAANGPAELPDAAAALAAKGVQAIVQIVDNLSAGGFPSISRAAENAKIPVFSFNSSTLEQGAMLSVSRDYVDAGWETGELVARVMGGESPANIPFAPPRTVKREMDREAAARAGLVIPQGLEELLASGNPIDAPQEALPGKKWKIQLIQLLEAPAITASREGVLAGIKEAGLTEGRDFEFKIRDAQGEIANLNSLIDAALTDQADMIYTITTPALQNAMQKVKDRPVLFALALDPLLIGDTGTHERHRPNVTGVFDRSPFESMMALIKEILPNTRRLGTLYAPGEFNAVTFKDALIATAAGAGFEAIALPSNSPAEASDSALALTQRGVDLITQINDNLHGACFPTIAKAGERAHIPVFSFSSGDLEQGAAITLSNDHFDGGRESGLLAAQVMRGKSPAAIPYQGIHKVKLRVNLKAAAAMGLTIPDQIAQRADSVLR